MAMPESLRAARGHLIALLSAAWDVARAALRSLGERLPGWIASARATCAELLHRLADAVAPAAPVAEPPADEASQEFAQMLADLGATPVAPGQDTGPSLEQTTVRALTDNLRGLRDLGDQLARTEQTRLALAARVAELEDGRARAADLGQRLEQREELLARTREQLAGQRAKTDAWKRKAAARWREIRALRKQAKDLERAAEVPGPLPQSDVSATRPKARAD